ncbi:MAG TPA: hypothetical protein VM491_22900, partial [Burkholderiaceae bacterium]|nr:hypothetical protein [Burkholderiaceae bacterium]
MRNGVGAHGAAMVARSPGGLARLALRKLQRRRSGADAWCRLQLPNSVNSRTSPSATGRSIHG